MIDALRRPEGATIKELQDITGWQVHTIRAVLSGLNNGRTGDRPTQQVPLERAVEDGRTYYRAAKAA